MILYQISIHRMLFSFSLSRVYFYLKNATFVHTNGYLFSVECKIPLKCYVINKALGIPI